MIENLLSYTLLSSGKYPYHPQTIDVTRLLRLSAASWYPVFENEQFEIELDITSRPIYWEVDPAWFERILDNLFQNINRHASAGKYVHIRFQQDGRTEKLKIADRGPGMSGESNVKGVGIGLTIVALMLEEMELEWDVESSDTGTVISIWKSR